MPLSSERYTGSDYIDKNPQWHAEDAPWKAEQIASLLKERNISPESFLDVGCGTGRILSALVTEHFPKARGVGYDIASQPIMQAQSEAAPPLELHVGDITLTEERGYDVLLCIDVFEHVEDYMGFLRKLRGRARYYVFHIPLDLNFKAILRARHMREREEVGHLHYFDSLSARATLADTGYRIVAERFTKKADPHWKARVLELASGLIAPISGPDRAVRLFGGRSLLVLAEEAQLNVNGL
ncbi:class I SAM-dependent methyltransferase [Alsobacter sp. SYSU BS001988]